MHWATFFLVFFSVFLVVNVILLVRSPRSDARNWLVIVGMLGVSGFGMWLLFYYCAEVPASGLYQVRSVSLPSYADQKTMVLKLNSAGGHERELLKTAIGSIPGFNHCCEEHEVNCGCIRIESSFWALSAKAKVVPCPGQTFVPYSGCDKPEQQQ